MVRLISQVHVRFFASLSLLYCFVQLVLTGCFTEAFAKVFCICRVRLLLQRPTAAATTVTLAIGWIKRLPNQCASRHGGHMQLSTLLVMQGSLLANSDRCEMSRSACRSQMHLMQKSKQRMSGTECIGGTSIVAVSVCSKLCSPIAFMEKIRIPDVSSGSG